MINFLNGEKSRIKKILSYACRVDKLCLLSRLAVIKSGLPVTGHQTSQLEHNTECIMSNEIIPHEQQFTQAFCDPQARDSQVNFSKNRIQEFETLASNATSKDWRQFWLELVELHSAAIQRLERMNDES